MFFRLIALVLLMLTAFAACAGGSEEGSAGNAGGGQQPPAKISAPGTTASQLLTAQAAPSCTEDMATVQQIQAEFAANRLRAEEKYVGQHICVSGAISGYREGKSAAWVYAVTKEGAEFFLAHRRSSSVSKAKRERAAQEWPGWREWMLSTNVGDAVEAECRVTGFTGSAEGVFPQLEYCKRVVEGILWTPPPPTPLPPTPTPPTLACTRAELGDRSSGEWLIVDCPAGEVAVGWWAHRDRESGEFVFLADGGQTAISFQYITYPEGEDRPDVEYSGMWTRRVMEFPGGEYAGEMWEAPPDLAAAVISRWRSSGADLVGVIFGECCETDIWFDPTLPPEPAQEREKARVAPDPTLVPNPTPTPLPRPTHTPTPTPTLAPTPRPTPLPDQSPLTAGFRGVPASHNGRDAIQFRLLFTEPVSVSYKTLRDVAIEVENGSALESKRVDKQSDMWMITIEPEGNREAEITLTAPADCADPAAVCTDGGKALANSPMVSVRYRQ